jgi:hypothetical protein
MGRLARAESSSSAFAWSSPEVVRVPARGFAGHPFGFDLGLEGRGHLRRNLGHGRSCVSARSRYSTPIPRYTAHASSAAATGLPLPRHRATEYWLRSRRLRTHDFAAG